MHTCVLVCLNPFSFLSLRTGSSFTEQFIYNSGLVSKSRRNVCNKVLAGWDFNVCDKKSANLQKQAVKRGLEVRLGGATARRNTHHVSLCYLGPLHSPKEYNMHSVSVLGIGCNNFKINHLYIVTNGSID